MNLQNAARNFFSEVWLLWGLVEAYRNDDIFGFIVTLICADQIGLPVFFLHGRLRPRTAPAAKNVLRNHEAVGVVSAIFRTRHAHLKIRTDQSEGIPALVAPRILRPLVLAPIQCAFAAAASGNSSWRLYRQEVVGERSFWAVWIDLQTRRPAFRKEPATRRSRSLRGYEISYRRSHRRPPRGPRTLARLRPDLAKFFGTSDDSVDRLVRHVSATLLARRISRRGNFRILQFFENRLHRASRVSQKFRTTNAREGPTHALQNGLPLHILWKLFERAITVSVALDRQTIAAALDDQIQSERSNPPVWRNSISCRQEPLHHLALEIGLRALFLLFES